MASARFFTLSDFGRYHCKGVAIQCRRCQHTVQVSTTELNQLFGMDCRVKTAEARLKCRYCGLKWARLIPLP